MNPTGELMLESIQQAYALIERYGISLTSLSVIAVLLLIALMFAAREAAAWFFKVEDVKSDISRLQEVVLQLEGEIRVLQGLSSRAETLATDLQNQTPIESKAVFATLAAATSTKLVTPKQVSSQATQPEPSNDSESNTEKRTSFPIVH
jgi:hypothetical protein